MRLPEDLAQQAEAVARVQGSSVNQLVVDSLRAEIERVRADEDFTARARRLIERDQELLDPGPVTRYLSLAEYLWLSEQVTGISADVLSPSPAASNSRTLRSMLRCRASATRTSIPISSTRQPCCVGG